MGFFSSEWQSKSLENKIRTIIGITFVIVVGIVFLIMVFGFGMLFIEWVLGKVMS